MAKMDRGLDARQKLINALKSQLSKSAALPKAAPPSAAPAPVLIPEEQVLSSPLLQAAASSPVHGAPAAPPSVAPDSWEAFAAPSSPIADEPEAKRARTMDAGPGGAVAAAAQSDALAARKASMLRTLGVASSSREPAQLAPAPGSAPSAGLPQMSQTCPPGTSPAEFEAYRQKCWREYYDYCAVWQKYYDKHQAEGGAPAAQAKAKGCGKGGPPPGVVLNPAFAQSHAAPPVMRPPPGAPAPGWPPAGGGSAFVAAARGVAAGAASMDDDIHSKLLGL